MQTKLRIFVSLVVASLLWTSPTSAANSKSSHGKAPAVKKLRYIGVASWYGQNRQGRKMANGQRFDCHKLTAASWYFPFGTQIRVLNVKNGQSVVVTITDRGPNMRLHRVLDLSAAAAEQLDYLGDGLTSVFLYPVVSFNLEPAPINVRLEEPTSPKFTLEAKAEENPL
jgi:rare lipoprotein A